MCEDPLAQIPLVWGDSGVGQEGTCPWEWAQQAGVRPGVPSLWLLIKLVTLSGED